MTKKEAKTLFDLLSNDDNAKAEYTDDIQILSINEVSRHCIPEKLWKETLDSGDVEFRPAKKDGTDGHIKVPTLASGDDDVLELEEELVVASVYFATALCAVKEGFQNKQNKKALEIIKLFKQHKEENAA